METTGSTSSEVTIRLTGSEALILSHALASAERRETLAALHDDDPATRRVVADLIASFEPVVDEAFAANYNDRIERARRDVLGSS